MSRGCDKKRALLASIKKNILKVNRPQVEINAKAVRHAQKKSDRCPKLLSPFIFLLSSSSFFLSFFPYKDAHERYSKPTSQPASQTDCRPPKLTFVQAVLAGKGEKTVSLFSRSVGGHNDGGDVVLCARSKSQMIATQNKKKARWRRTRGKQVAPHFLSWAAAAAAAATVRVRRRSRHSWTRAISSWMKQRLFFCFIFFFFFFFHRLERKCTEA